MVVSGGHVSKEGDLIICLTACLPLCRQRWTPESVGKTGFSGSWEEVQHLRDELFRSYADLGPSAYR